MNGVMISKYLCLSVLGSALWLMPAHAAIIGGMGMDGGAAIGGTGLGLGGSAIGAAVQEAADAPAVNAGSAGTDLDASLGAGAPDLLQDDCTGGGVDAMRKCLREQMQKEIAVDRTQNAGEMAAERELSLAERQSIYEEKTRKRGRVVIEMRDEIGEFATDEDAHVLSQWAREEVAILRHNLPEDANPETQKKRRMQRESRSSLKNWALGNHDMMEAREEMRSESRDMGALLREGRAISSERIASRHGGG